MSRLADDWLQALGQPAPSYAFKPAFDFQQSYKGEGEGYLAEFYEQANGPSSSQRVLLLLPTQCPEPVPAVVVPFYFPEAMLGFELNSGQPLPRYAGIEMMLHLCRKGFACISAEAYHLTYKPSSRSRDDFQRWGDMAAALLADNPNWSGMGKLVADTRLLIDALSSDPRIDAGRIGICGHSLGGKMAFYTACLDERIKATLASDFGFCWPQSNWHEAWYWGGKLAELKARGMDHSQLLGLAAPKPFFLIAGEYDNEESWQLMQKAPGYEKYPERRVICNHASGHRPPMKALEKGYQFLEQFLCKEGRT
jgi:hypothetical protein